jgi:cold shock CspA family protein
MTTQSRYTFAREAETMKRRTGVVARIVASKYGFIRTDKEENIFFPFKELSVDVMACIERGSCVEFEVTPNPHENNKPMAKNISVKTSTNQYTDSVGFITRWIPEKQFGFIETDDGTCYFAHQTAFQQNSDLTDLKVGAKVTFDKSINYKSSPPKPFAMNARIVPNFHASTERPTLVAGNAVSAIKGKPAIKPWTPSPRTLKSRSSESCDLSDKAEGPELHRPSLHRSSLSSWPTQKKSVGVKSWRSPDRTPASSLFQKYCPPKQKDSWRCTARAC